MIVPSFFTATAYQSEESLDSLSHTNASLTVAAHTFFIYVVAANIISFEKLFQSSYSLRTFFPTSMLQNFHVEIFS